MSNPGITNLVDWWAFNEASGNRTGSHASIVLTDNNTVAAGTGILGNGADFEFANSEYLEAADSAALSLGADSDFTICFWWKPESTVADNVLISKQSSGSANNMEFRIRTNSGTTPSLVVGNGSTFAIATSSTTISAGNWYFIVAYHDKTGNVIGISVNAGTPDTTAWAGGTQDTTGVFRVGREGGGTSYADGIMDELCYYKDRLLTSAEITWLYNGGVGRSYADLLASGFKPIIAMM